MNYSSPTPAFLFDLDGTLVDSVYQHVLAWREALESCGIQLSLWRIHRRAIAISGRGEFAWQTLCLLDIGPGATCDYQKPRSAREV